MKVLFSSEHQVFFLLTFLYDLIHHPQVPSLPLLSVKGLWKRWSVFASIFFTFEFLLGSHAKVFHFVLPNISLEALVANKLIVFLSFNTSSYDSHKVDPVFSGWLTLYLTFISSITCLSLKPKKIASHWVHWNWINLSLKKHVCTFWLWVCVRKCKWVLQYIDKSKPEKNGMYTANGLASFFIISCSLSAWRREDGTCSISVRGLHLPYTILHCEFINAMHLLGHHSLFSP